MGWFKTGDIGYVTDENTIKITGRIKSMSKLNNGKFIDPQ